MPVLARILRYEGENNTPTPDGKMLLRVPTFFVNTDMAPADFGYALVYTPEVLLDPATPDTWSTAVKAAIVAFAVTTQFFSGLQSANVYYPTYSLRSDVEVAIVDQMDDWSAPGTDEAFIVRLMPSADWAVTGITGGYAGRYVGFHNFGPGKLTWYLENVQSLPENRFAMTPPSFVQYVGQTVWIYYSSTLSRWEVVQQPASSVGALFRIQLAYSDGLFTTADANGSFSPIYWDFAADCIAAGGFRVDNGKLQEVRGAPVASANTITCPTNQTPITVGVWPINGIDTAGWQAGSRIALELPAAGLLTVAVTHNSGAPGAGALPVLLRDGISLIPGLNTYLLELRNTGTAWWQPG